MYDIIIENGTVIDGTGSSRYWADIGITNDRIEAVEDLKDARAKQTIEAKGKIVCPGFIDVHSHSDGWLLKMPHFLPKTFQGFTTEVLMADGMGYAPVNKHLIHEWTLYLQMLNGLSKEDYIGWESLEDLMQQFEGKNVQNVMAHVPYANIRVLACGFGKAGPDKSQMKTIQAEIEKGMAQGAVGLSTGLDYMAQCFASTDELVQACSVLTKTGGFYVTHIRYDLGRVNALKEAVEIGKKAGVPVHISHLMGSTQKEGEDILAYIEKQARNEVDFSFDTMPYFGGSTVLDYILPDEVFEEGARAAIRRLKDPAVRRKISENIKEDSFSHTHIAYIPGKPYEDLLGMNINEFIEQTGKPPADALADLLIETEIAVLMVYRYGDDETVVGPFLAHDLAMMGTDNIYWPKGFIHPRCFGTAPRLLGPCVREWKVCTLEQAVYKLSGHPAARFGLKHRGFIKPGYFADLVIFNEDQVTDRATYEKPQQHAVGIDYVLVNGVMIIKEANEVKNVQGPLPGRYLKYNQ